MVLELLMRTGWFHRLSGAPAKKSACRIRSLAGFACGLLLLAAEPSCSLWGQDLAVAQITEIVNRVEFSTNSGVTWKPAITNQPLFPGDEVRVDLNSRAVLTVTPVRGKPKLPMIIEGRARYRVSAEGSPLQLTFPGVFRILNWNVKQALAWVWQTVTVSGGVHRTDFTVQVGDNGETMIIVAEGEVHATNRLDHSNVMLLAPQEAARFDPNERTLEKVPYFDLKVQTLAQTFLYYPGLLHLDDLLPFSQLARTALEQSLTAYDVGNLALALAEYPENREPRGNAEKLYFAALVLASGQFQRAESLAEQVLATEPDYSRHGCIAEALLQVVAAVQNDEMPRPKMPLLATEWLAESYYQQSRTAFPYRPSLWEDRVYRKAKTALDRALIAAKHATPKRSTFGFGWIRRAELEFGFGRLGETERALANSGKHRLGNAEAIALDGFLNWAKNDHTAAFERFQEAAALDSRLGNAWLGIGLTELHSENVLGGSRRGKLRNPWRPNPDSKGLNSLERAVTAEPERSLLRSYLGKAYYESTGHWGKSPQLKAEAFDQLELAKRLDSKDPTPYLYTALIQQQENRINEAIEELERSIERNESRLVYRSRLLLDQDRAIRSANFASIYRDAGMLNRSIQEASRAVNSDYANHSAHLFLANSYHVLRDLNRINLRYETPTVSEYLIANLLAPVGGGLLSPSISQNEYSRLFERDGLRFTSSTAYLTDGDFSQNGSHFGRFGNTSYSIDASYTSERGQRSNSQHEQVSLSTQFKQQITPKDSLYIQAIRGESDFGDVRQYFDASLSDPSLKASEIQEPGLLAGFHHQWRPELHTLLLIGYFEDSLHVSTERFHVQTKIKPTLITANIYDKFDLDFGNEYAFYTAELQQIYLSSRQTLILGARFQSGQSDSLSTLLPIPGLRSDFLQPDIQEVSANARRASLYGYQNWDLCDAWRLMAGASYDYLDYPANVTLPPFTPSTRNVGRFSPKVGVLWRPSPSVNVRSAYTRSLGGFLQESSVRLEPTQVAGFNQAFRSLIPESVAGSTPGAGFETFGIGIDSRLTPGTFIDFSAEMLHSKTERVAGAFEIDTEKTGPLTAERSSSERQLDFREQSLGLTVNQLVGDQWSLTAAYAISLAELDGLAEPISTDIPSNARTDDRALLHSASLISNYYHPSGFFGQAQALWLAQRNRGHTSEISDDDLWQLNLLFGYRFPRRAAEMTVGLLNLTDRDYRLNPLNLYTELPRQRALLLKFDCQF